MRDVARQDQVRRSRRLTTHKPVVSDATLMSRPVAVLINPMIDHEARPGREATSSRNDAHGTRAMMHPMQFIPLAPMLGGAASRPSDALRKA